jgi:DNA polymerase-3 subunit alpha
MGIAINECRRLGVTVLPPDVNHSFASFSIESNGNQDKPAIRFGLSAIKNVGNGAESIILEREKNGPYKSIEDFCRRLGAQSSNRRVLESLIKAGALDGLLENGANRGGLLHNIDRVLSLAQTEQKLRSTGQATMFDLFGSMSPVPMPGLELGGEDVREAPGSDGRISPNILCPLY